MRAVVIRKAGGPEMLKLERLPVPVPDGGQVLIRVEAFGLNRSEMFTRQSHSPDVIFPRVLGIEAVGTVAAAPGGGFARGDKVATVTGGMGRASDGGYAEYACVPAGQVRAFHSDLPWEKLGALHADGFARCSARAGDGLHGGHGRRPLVDRRFRADGRHPDRGVADDLVGRGRGFHGDAAPIAD
jgi:NADPH:quinone reductase-like Zn-dependent oxidoreductase